MTTVFLLALAMATAGLWFLVERCGPIARGRVAPFFGARGGPSFTLFETPFRFFVHAVGWLVAAVGLTLGGGVVLAGLDAWLLVLPPCSAACVWIATGAMALAGGTSGDAARGSLDALAGKDRAELARRVDTLPHGSERRMFQDVLDAWTEAAPPDAYRGAADPERRARFDALQAAAAKEQRNLRRRGWAIVMGGIPFVVFGIERDEITMRPYALWGAGMTLALAVGGVAFIIAATRRVDAIAAEAATMIGRDGR